jgi:hypothetical protein
MPRDSPSGIQSETAISGPGKAVNRALISQEINNLLARLTVLLLWLRLDPMGRGGCGAPFCPGCPIYLFDKYNFTGTD